MQLGYRANAVSCCCCVAVNGLPLRKQSAAVSISAAGWVSDTRQQRREGRAGEWESQRSMVSVCEYERERDVVYALTPHSV